MRKLIVLIILVFIITPLSFGQDVKFYTDKESYKINEKIELKLEIGMKVDLPVLLDSLEFDNFKTTNLPYNNSQVSMTRNSSTNYYHYSWTYILRPQKIGTFKLESPVFYSNGTKIDGIKRIVEIKSSDLNAQELKEFQFDAFIEDVNKPKGTYRYILNEEFGYIQKYDNYKWVFYRKLSDDELELLNGVK